MTVKPEAANDIAQRIADRYAEKNKATLRKAWEEGFLTFSSTKPQDALMGYLMGTIGGEHYLLTGEVTGDLAILLQEGYVEAREAKMAPPLMAEQIHQARTLSLLMNANSGNPGGQEVMPEGPMLWVHLGKLPSYVWGWAISDLRKLMREHERKREAA